MKSVQYCPICENRLPGKHKCPGHPTPGATYALPPIIKQCGECGIGVKIACQDSACKETSWRIPSHLAQAKSHYHNDTCARKNNSWNRRTSVTRACSCGCKRKVSLQPYRLKLAKNFFYSKKCKAEFQRLDKSKLRDQKIRTEGNALLQCVNGCEGIDGDKITEHTPIKGSTRYRCVECSKERDGAIKVKL